VNKKPFVLSAPKARIEGRAPLCFDTLRHAQLLGTNGK
jgi:hypothetical protein